MTAISLMSLLVISLGPPDRSKSEAFITSQQIVFLECQTEDKFKGKYVSLLFYEGECKTRII